MQITTNISNQNLIISLSGRLDTMTSTQLEEEINRNSLDEIETVTLNMRALEYISSAGLRVILMLYKKLTSVGGKLRLVNVNDMIMEIFTMTGMDSFLEIENA
ncbi:MAG: STAS domain-containing protein [Acutalibacteraceae bacterium]